MFHLVIDIGNSAQKIAVFEQRNLVHTEITTSLDSKKLAQMFADGKTDGNPNILSPVVTIREWIDQAAAEEFRDFILGLDEKYGPGLVVSIVIEDAN